MKIKQDQFSLTTGGRSIIDITSQVNQYVEEANIQTGLCNIFLHHTSASLIICENADHLVQVDLESFMTRLVPDGDAIYQHTDEGIDDMPSHVRTVLTQSSLMIPITKAKLALGRWQGIYLWEHRLRSHHRKVTVTTQGE